MVGALPGGCCTRMDATVAPQQACRQRKCGRVYEEEMETMIPPELRRMLSRIAGKRTAGPIQIAAALVGGWTHGELLTFGFRRTTDGWWEAPTEWMKP